MYLDVNFGGTKGVTRIIMYPNDTPDGIANRFAKEHNLSKEKRDRLVEAIQAHLKQALAEKKK